MPFELVHALVDGVVPKADDQNWPLEELALPFEPEESLDDGFADQALAGFGGSLDDCEPLRQGEFDCPLLSLVEARLICDYSRVSTDCLLVEDSVVVAHVRMIKQKFWWTDD